jgi:hypothetical protein
MESISSILSQICYSCTVCTGTWYATQTRNPCIQNGKDVMYRYLVSNSDAESIHTGIPAPKLGATMHKHMIEEKGQIALRKQLAKSSPASMMFSSKQRVPHHDIDSMSNQHTTQSNNREKYKYTHVCASRF